MTETPRRFDYIVVGAGSAGCVLAARLSQAPDTRVLLLEAGGRDWDPLLRVPLMAGVLLRGRRYNWSYRSEPVPGLNGRCGAWPRGKLLGGSSAINGMVYTRGFPSDYDAWATAGLAGWSFAELLPYFRRSEDFSGAPGRRHGLGGPLPVSRLARPSNPLFDVFVEAGRQAGHPVTDDFNGVDPAGFGRYHFNIRNGRRVSSADAYLGDAGPNLTIWTRAHAERLIFDLRRAVAVRVRRSGKTVEARAEREIVLCGGTVNSPQLLMLSGVGEAEHLRRHGIEVVADRAEVGRNLADHLLVRVQYAATRPITLGRLRRADRAILAVARALIFGTGPGASFPLEAGAFMRSDPALDEPDLQSHFLPALSTDMLRWRPLASDEHGFMANVYALRPLSRGAVRLAGADPAAPPRIQPNYLSEPRDLALLRRGVRLLRQVFAQAAFDPYRGAELAPGEAVRSDEDLDAWIRRTADTVFHPVGTCRMGADADAVVDGRLGVRGVEAVRVVDASVFPAMISGNTHAPTVMVAEKAADMILGRDPLPREPEETRPAEAGRA